MHPPDPAMLGTLLCSPHTMQPRPHHNVYALQGAIINGGFPRIRDRLPARRHSRRTLQFTITSPVSLMPKEPSAPAEFSLNLRRRLKPAEPPHPFIWPAALSQAQLMPTDLGSREDLEQHCLRRA